MPSAKLISILLIAVFAIPSLVIEARAAQGPEMPIPHEPTQQVPAPNEARIVSDLTSHYLFLGTAALAAGPSRHDRADSTSIRSSVRKGEVLEFRVTSVYYADPNGEPQRAVDSIVRYQMDGGRWALLGVQTEGARIVLPGNPGNMAEPC